MKTYFDIGANKGDYTNYLLTNLNADKVICVEANKFEANVLSSRYVHNNVIIINKAISNINNESIPFYVCPECDVVSTADEQWRTNSRFSQPDRQWIKTLINTITIDELIKEYGIPTHIKLDVEGYEYVALQGMTKNYCQLRFEWAEEKIDEMVLSLQHLIKIGYTTFGVMAGDTYHSIPEEYMSGTDMIEFLKNKCDPARKDLWGMIFCLRDEDSYVV